MTPKGAKGRWDIYQFPPSFVLGFHGCDEAVGEALLSGKTPHLVPSVNKYDWLGTGIYFWEGNPQRASEFASERAAGAPISVGNIKAPFVIGAIINLGRCLDMRDTAALLEVKESFEVFQLSQEGSGQDMPRNKGKELEQRHLDCAVMNFLHKQREDWGWPSYDTVRADFWEGEQLYPGAGFREQDHIQICVRNTSSILGYFRPIPATD